MSVKSLCFVHTKQYFGCKLHITNCSKVSTSQTSYLLEKNYRATKEPINV